jgi:uncharacterized protein with HEPN domain
MPPEVKKYLTDMTDAATQIGNFCAGRSESDFTGDKQLRSAVYYQFVIVGEALSQLRKLDETIFDHISEASRIIAFRNQVIHGYPAFPRRGQWPRGIRIAARFPRPLVAALHVGFQIR